MPTISRLDISLLDSFLLDDTTASPPAPSISDAYQFINAAGTAIGLQNANIVTATILYSGPKRDLSRAAYPRADGEYMQADYWRENKIVLTGTIKDTTRDLLEARIDQLRTFFNASPGTLMLTFAGAQRYFDNVYADIETMLDKRIGSYITFTPFTLTFYCAQPFGRDANRTYFAASTPLTATPTVYDIYNGGSAKTFGLWTFTINTAGTFTGLTLYNTTTGEAIVISGTFVNGDTLVIDAEQKIVTQNGTEIDYTGIFPSITVGQNSVTAEPVGAGYSIAVNEEHYNRYL